MRSARRIARRRERCSGAPSTRRRRRRPLRLHRRCGYEYMSLRVRFRAPLRSLAAAFEARSYPTDLQRAVELAIEDPHLADNAGGWRIEVSGGRARVTRAAAASARVDVATLGAIWSGMLAPADARRLGRLVADDETVRTLGEMFAGPLPWINDWFW